MREYIRNRVDNVVTVRAIVTVLRLDLRSRAVAGERHDFPEIYYVEQEESETVIDGQPMELSAGSMVIYAPNTFHGYQQRKSPGGIVEIISFETDSAMLEPLYNRPIRLNPRQRERFEALIARGLRLFAPVEGGTPYRGTVLRDTADLRELQQLKNLLELFLLDISRGIEAGAERPVCANQEQLYRQQMEHLTAFLTQHLSENLSLEQMQAAMGLSESSLRRLVRKFKGCGPVAYFQELKIRAAKELIRSSSMNMGQIAEHLGFSSPHYFSRVFREKTGMTPTDYARNG